MIKFNTKFQTMSVVIPVVLLLLVLMPDMQHSVGITGLTFSGSSNSTNSISGTFSTSQSTCTFSVDKQTQAELKSINMQQAKLLVTQNSDFQSKIKGYGNTFDSIFVEGSFDPGCTVVWHDVNVVYDMTDSKGQYVKHIIAREDPLLSKVLGVSEQTGKMKATAIPSHFWSGYEFYYNQANGTSYRIWETNSSWSVPSIYYPTNAQTTPVCDWAIYPTCDMSVWIGLEDEEGAYNNDLVQGGSDSNETCTSNSDSSCTKNYSLWYEFLNNPSVNNGSMIWCNDTVHPGDVITSLINDTTRNPGGSSSNYTISIQDISNSTDKVCGATNQGDNMTKPILADFIIERHETDSNYLTLANFSSITMSGTMYYNNSYHSIQAPANANFSYQVLMEN